MSPHPVREAIRLLRREAACYRRPLSQMLGTGTEEAEQLEAAAAALAAYFVEPSDEEVGRIRTEVMLHTGHVSETIARAVLNAIGGDQP